MVRPVNRLLLAWRLPAHRRRLSTLFAVDEHLPETLRAVEHELAALLRRGRALSWEIAREVHPNLEPGKNSKRGRMPCKTICRMAALPRWVRLQTSRTASK